MKINSKRLTALYNGMKTRCNNPKDAHYQYYGGKGVQVIMTKEEVADLWLRDKAYLMKKPTIDRIDSDGNYEVSNCRFVEHSINILAKRLPDEVRHILKVQIVCECCGKEFTHIVRRGICQEPYKHYNLTKTNKKESNKGE